MKTSSFGDRQFGLLILKLLGSKSGCFSLQALHKGRQHWFKQYFHFCQQVFIGVFILLIQFLFPGCRAAHNKCIAASGAGRWLLRLPFFIRLWLGLEVSNVAFSFYLQLIKKTGQRLPEGSFSIAPPAAILVRWAQYNFKIMEETKSVFNNLGIPEALSTTVTLIFVGLTLSAFIAGADFGIFKVPQFNPSLKTPLKIIAPIMLALCLLCYAPIKIFKGKTNDNAFCLKIKNDASELAKEFEERLPQTKDDIEELKFTASAAHCNEISKYECNYINKDSANILKFLLNARKQLNL